MFMSNSLVFKGSYTCPEECVDPEIGWVICCNLTDETYETYVYDGSAWCMMDGFANELEQPSQTKKMIPASVCKYCGGPVNDLGECEYCGNKHQYQLDSEGGFIHA